MENTTLVNGSDNPVGIASEQTLATPRFDEISIQNARPAVPLARNKARPFWPLALVVMCASSLIGGVLALAFSRYENRTPAASAAPEGSRVSIPTSRDSDRVAKNQSQKPPPSLGGQPETSVAEDEPQSAAQDGQARAALHGALDEWVAATNARDIQRQMNFYNPTVNAFYRARNVPRATVRAEKSRVFGSANVIDIQAGAPGIRLSPDGLTATMQFRKKYAIEGGGEERRGEVVQELRWRRTGDGWKIVSERDLRVIN